MFKNVLLLVSRTRVLNLPQRQQRPQQQVHLLRYQFPRDLHLQLLRNIRKIPKLHQNLADWKIRNPGVDSTDYQKGRACPALGMGMGRAGKVLPRGGKPEKTHRKVFTDDSDRDRIYLIAAEMAMAILIAAEMAEMAMASTMASTEWRPHKVCEASIEIVT